MVHQTFINIAILPVLAVIISSHKVVGQQPTYWPTYWPTYAPTAAEAEYGQEKSVQDETWIDWGTWEADLKALISGGGGEGENDDNGDRSIDGQDSSSNNNNNNSNNNRPNVPSPTYEPTYEPTSYEPTALEQTLQYDRPPPKASNTGVKNAYGVTVTLVAAVIVSATFLFV